MSRQHDQVDDQYPYFYASPWNRFCGSFREAIFSIIFICFATSADDISLYFHYFYDKMILLFTLLLHLCINQRLIIGSFHRFDRIWLTLFISSFRCGLTDRKLFITSQSS